MNNRFFLAVLVSTVIAFFSGWLIFGIVFADYYGSHTLDTAKVIVKAPPVMWLIAIANIAWVLLLTCVLHQTRSTSFVKGFVTSLWVSFLIILIFDLSVYAFWDIYQFKFIALDILITSLFWAVIGAISGTILGTGQNKGPTS